MPYTYAVIITLFHAARASDAATLFADFVAVDDCHRYHAIAVIEALPRCRLATLITLMLPR